jgi:acyl-CoA synthetase (AMP-forming)/AMP-acid ligase II/acyl carrier protein/short-subunit dehydrogenase
MSNHKLRQEVLANNLIYDAHIIEYKEETFCFYVLLNTKAQDASLQELKSRYQQINFINVFFLPTDETGKVNEQALLKNFSFIDCKKIEKEIAASSKSNVHIYRKLIWLNHKIESNMQYNMNKTNNENDIIAGKSSHIIGNTIEFSNKPKNLLSALIKSAQDHPNKGITYINERGKSRKTTYKEILLQASSVADYAKDIGEHNSKYLIIIVKEHDNYFICFWAAILAGHIPVAITMPTLTTEINSITDKIYNTWQTLHKPAILTTSDNIKELSNLNEIYNDFHVKTICYENYLRPTLSNSLEPLHKKAETIEPSDIIFIQLTSGSTGIPKCILECHNNIIEHVLASAATNHYYSNEISLNWMPVDHVVPVITYHCRDIVLGSEQIHVATNYISSNLANWLHLIDKYKVSLTWAPNFGYRLLCNLNKPRKLAEQYNIKSIKHFMNAGEQVTPKVSEEFAIFLRNFNLKPEVIQPAFGMAELSTCVTYNNNFSIENSIIYLTKSEDEDHLRITSKDQKEYGFVALGEPICNIEIRIIDNNNNTLPELYVGMLQIKGSVLSNGYYSNQKANKNFNADGWFSSGDLGFVYNNNLFIYGRQKEQIIIRGQNFLCHEIEDYLNKIAGVKPTFCATSSFLNPTLGTEELIIFFVPTDNAKINSTKDKIRKTIFNSFKINAKQIITLSTKEFHKTSSGKIQRSRLKKHFINGDFTWHNDEINNDEQVFTKKWIIKNIPKNINHKNDTVYINLTKENKIFNNCHLISNNLDEIRAARILVITDFIHNDFSDREETYELKALNNFLYKLHHNHSNIQNIIILTIDTYNIDPKSNQNYRRGWLTGYITSLEKELELPKITIINFNSKELQSDIITKHISAETNVNCKDKLVSYENDRRYIETFTKISLPNNKSRILNSDAYMLIIGGTGGIGSKIAEEITKSYGKKVIITGTKDNSIIKTASNSYLEKHIKLNLENRDILANQLKKINENIDCVVYLAGYMREANTAKLGSINFNSDFYIKSSALIQVHNYFFNKDRECKFIVFASIAAILGSSNYSIYAACNSLTETTVGFIRAKHDTDISVNYWCPWKNTGMARKFDYDSLQHHLDFATYDTYEALKIFTSTLDMKNISMFFGIRDEFLLRNHLANPIKYYEYFVASSTSMATIKLPSIMDAKQNIIRLKFISKKVLENNNNIENIATVILTKLWQKHLETNHIDNTKNFFALGGDSLAAINLLIDIEEEFKVNISIQSLINAKNINDLLNYIIDNRNHITDKTNIKNLKTTKKISFGQQRILYLCQTGQNTAYNVYKVFNIIGKIDIKILTRTFDQLINNFPIIKTQYQYGENNIEQVQLPFTTVDIFNVININDLKQSDTHISNEIRTSFDIFSNTPLIKINLYSINTNQHKIVFNIHHSIVDEWSLELMLKYISQTYNTLSQSSKLQHNSYNDNFYKYISYESSNQTKPTKEFLDTIYVNSNHPFTKQIKFSTNGEILTASILKSLFNKIKEIANNNSLTPAIIFHGLLSIAIAKIFKIKKFNIGIPITHHDDIYLRDSFGFLVNTSIIGCNIDFNQTAINIFAQIKESYLLAIMNRKVPYSTLLKNINTAEPFQVMYVYEKFINDWQIDGLEIKEEIIHNSTAKLPLTCFIKFPEKNCPLLCLEYCNDIATPKLIADIMQEIQNLAYKIITDNQINSPIKDI